MVSPVSQQLPLTVRKRAATRERIATCAAELVVGQGLAATTAEHIAAAADVGRATFFRYFSSKEDAVAEGMTRHWLDRITDAITRQPPEFSPGEVVVAAFDEMARGFDEISAQIREIAALTRSSPALNAWTLMAYVRYENAIAALIADRFGDLAEDDQRPRLLGALAMAAVRIALDDWLIQGGSLPQRVRSALSAVAVR